MSGRRWLRAVSDTQWGLVLTDTTTGVMANPTPSFYPTVSGATVRLDGSGSFSTNGPITAYSWDAGDGTLSTQQVWSHTYSSPGTYSVRLSVTDSTGRTGTYVASVVVTTSNPNPNPTAAFTSSVGTDGRTVTFSGASSSIAAPASITTYTWTFGDGTAAVSSSTPSTTHVYGSDGTFNPTLTVTASTGTKASISHPVTTKLSGGGGGGGGGGDYVAPWKAGVYDEGLPSSVVVVEFTTLYNLLTPSEQQAESSLLLAMGKLPSYLASKGYGSYAAVHFPNGYDGLIPGFSLGTSIDTYAHGFGFPACIGLLGGMSNGALQARFRMKPNSMTPGQLDYVSKLVVTGSGGTSGFTTNPFAAIYMSGQNTGRAQYIMGMQFDGADMQTVTDYRETGPACWSGLALYRSGPGMIVQNTLLRGFGRADSTSPPGETGAIGGTHDISAIYRRFEVDGRLPNDTTRRSGGFLWSGSDTPTVVDGWVHDAYTSGSSFSFSGSISPGNYSQNVTTTRFRNENNANHNGYVSGLRFAALNHEEPHGFVVHNNPTVGLDTSTNPYWDSTHMTYGNVKTPAGDVAASFTVNDPIVLDAATGGAYVGDNGCFSIKSSTTASIGLQTPVVTKNGVALQAWVRTGAGQAPSYVGPDTHFIWKHQG